jgi:hypothetical protein
LRKWILQLAEKLVSTIRLGKIWLARFISQLRWLPI